MRRFCSAVLCLLLLCGSPAWAVGVSVSYTDANSELDLKSVDGNDNVVYPPGSDNDNIVTVKFNPDSGTFCPEHVFGAYSILGSATGNMVTLEQGKIKKSVIGGYSKTRDASGNTVVIEADGEVEGTVHGGDAAKGDVTANKVTVRGKVTDTVRGGRAAEGLANNNHVFIEGATLGSGVEGGRASKTTASHSASYNTVAVTQKSAVMGQIYGGVVTSGKGSARNNDVVLTDSTTQSLVVGGYIMAVQDGGKAETNTVTMTNSQAREVYGAYSLSGDINENTVDMTESKTEMTIMGGFTEKGNAGDNTVIMEGGSVFGSIVGGNAEEGNVSVGVVELTGVTVGQNVIGGRSGKGDVVNSRVKFNGSKAVDIIGGRSENGNANSNKVNFDAGEAVRIMGGWGTGEVNDNVVFISGGTAGDVYGGFNNNNTKAGTASGNTVTITAGTVTRLYGGAANHPDSVVSNNTVNWHGGDITTHLVVGNGFKAENNTLNMHTSAKKVMILSGVQTYNFILPAETKKGDVILTVTDGGDFYGGPVALKGVTVNVALPSGTLGKGDKVTLIDSTKGFDTTKPTKGEGVVDFGTIVDFDITVEEGTGTQQLLVATVAGSDPGPTPGPTPGPIGRKNPQTKALLEGALGSFALVNQGSEMVAGQGMNSAVRAAKDVVASGPVAFGSLGGSMSRYNTGSHVKVEGVTFLAGLGWKNSFNEGKNGSILAGVFFETGFGNYNAHNSFANARSVHGKGDTRYVGGGVLGRYTLPAGLYAEASVRAGKVKNEYKSKDFTTNLGQRAEYDSSVAYVGAHGGLGYLWQFRESTSLDFSTKYLWTRQGSDNLKMGRANLHLDSVSSHRWRTGARLTHEAVLGNGVVASPYVGAAFDYEFGGKQKGTFKSLGKRRNIDSPTLKGGTGVGEVGLTVKPSAVSPVSFDFAVQGYAGKREGVSGNVNLRYEF